MFKSGNIPMLRLFLALLIGVLIMGWFSYQLKSEAHDTWLSNLFLNLSSEFLGGFITFILIERIFNSWKEGEEEKRRLIEHLKSDNPEVASNTADDLRQKGWIKNGILRYADLRNINLPNCEHLGNADFMYADLRGANLEGANLKNANLRCARLGNANLTGANLEGAKLPPRIPYYREGIQIHDDLA